jgi:hypothetical protein
MPSAMLEHPRAVGKRSLPTMSDSNTIHIPLTCGYFTVIDEIDREVATGKLQAAISKTSTKTYATKAMMTPSGRRPVRLHRLIMERVLGRPLLPTEHIDHADGDGLNNQRSNLRLCTKATNAVNSKRRSDNQSGYKGVCFHPFSGLWRAYIRAEGKQHSLGYYKTPQEAHKAYKVAAVKFYGEFARFE